MNRKISSRLDRIKLVCDTSEMVIAMYLKKQPYSPVVRQWHANHVILNNELKALKSELKGGKNG